jgi:hypothetical protein
MASYILETAIQNYLRERPSKQAYFDELEELRHNFVEKFPIKSILKMTLDEYVQGKRSHDSFCYWMENRLKSLGDIHGGTSEKFGVYYSKEDGDYRYTEKFAQGGNIEQAFDHVKESIKDLLHAGKQENLTSINANPISNMLKGKILSTYFPHRYLDIYDWKHLNFFLEKLNLYEKNLGKHEEIKKREILINLRNSHPILQEWTLQEFVKFLYWHIGHPRDYKPEEIPETDEDLIETPVFPPFSEAHPEFLDTLPSSDKIQKDRTKTGNRKPVKIDFEADYRRRKEIGEKGELYVLEMEKQWLKKHNMTEFLTRVKHTSQEDDGAGYDIESVELDGKPKYIEVKSTVSVPGKVNFYLTENELKTASEKDNYYIYVVFSVATLAPKIWRWRHPFKEEMSNVKREPVLYRVTYSPE